MQPLTLAIKAGGCRFLTRGRLPDAPRSTTRAPTDESCLLEARWRAVAKPAVAYPSLDGTNRSVDDEAHAGGQNDQGVDPRRLKRALRVPDQRAETAYPSQVLDEQGDDQCDRCRNPQTERDLAEDRRKHDLSQGRWSRQVHGARRVE